MAVGGALGDVAVAVHEDAERAGERDHGGVEHRDLDELALSGALAVQQRAQDPGEQMHAGQEVADGRARPSPAAGRIARSRS